VEGLFPLLELDYENIRAALTWAWETGDERTGLRMVSRLRRFWDTYSQFQEGLDWLERFVARASDSDDDDLEERDTLAQAWTGVMVMAHRLDRFERARAAGEAALALRRTVGDKNNIAAALSNLANVLTQLRDYDRARALFEECLALLRQTNNRQGMVFPLGNLGIAYLDSGRPREALAYFEESLALSQELGERDYFRISAWDNIGEALIVLDEPLRAVEVTEPAYQMCLREHSDFWAATCAFTLGRAHWRLGAMETAHAYLDEALRRYEAFGSAVMSARVCYFRASLAIEQGNILAAQHDLSQALAGFIKQPDASEFLWWLIERAATLAYRCDRREQSAYLYGAAMAHRGAFPRLMEPAETEMRARDLDQLRATLGEEIFAQEISKGQDLTLSEAIAALRGELGSAANGMAPG
jgi:tetratricopeptide (TPR) repeat protein